MSRGLFSVGVILLALVATTNCGMCGETTISEEPSPRGGYVASVLERNCGATTDFVAHVNLHQVSDRFRANSTGTITRGEVFVAEGRPHIEVVWADETNLSIKCVGARRVFKNVGTWEDVAISYNLVGTERSSDARDALRDASAQAEDPAVKNTRARDVVERFQYIMAGMHLRRRGQ